MPDPCPLLLAPRPLHPTINDAASQGNLDDVRYYLDNNFYSTKFRCRKNWTPLHEAASHGHLAVVMLLVCRGAELDAKSNPNDMTALHFAISKGHTDIVNYLLNHDANPNDVTDTGDTPLHLAMELDRVDVADALLEHGADTRIKNKQNKRPADMVTRNRHPIITYGCNYTMLSGSGQK
jgi:ankyrin repeat protein